MTWIKADHTFDNRCAVFFVTRKHMAMEQHIFEAIRLHGNEDLPEHLESVVLELIHKYRPELDGCVVWHMGYDSHDGRWQFSVSHALLPKCPLWERPKAMPLDPALEREYAEAVS